MKALSVSHFVKATSENSGSHSTSKTAWESAAAGSGFGQLWHALLQPKDQWKDTSRQNLSGEIEIPIRRQAQKTEAVKQTATVSLPEKTSPGAEVMPSAQALPEKTSPFLQTENVSPSKGRSSQTTRLATSQIAPNEALPKAEEKPGQGAETVKKLAVRLMNALQKTGTLPHVTPGAKAQVTLDFSGAKRLPGKDQTLAKSALNGPKAKSAEIVFNLRHSTKNGWQIEKNELILNKGKIWKFRIVLPESEKPEMAGGAQVKAVPALKTTSGEITLEVLSLKKTFKTSASSQKEPELSLKVAVKNLPNPQSRATQESKAQQHIVRVTLGKEQASSGNATSTEKQKALVSPTSNDESGAKARASKASGNETVAPAGDRKTVKNELARVKSNGIGTLEKMPSQGSARVSEFIKSSGKPAVKPSLMLERIESLLSRAVKAKNSTSLKMQLSDSPFGKMDFQFDKKARQLSVMVESEKAKEAFLHLTPLIRQNLADKGFVLNDLRVSVGRHDQADPRDEGSNKEGAKRSKIQGTKGKEVENHELTSEVSLRKFGYNTLEVTA